MPYTIMLMRMKIGVIIGATTATATTVKFDFNYQLQEAASVGGLIHFKAMRPCR